MIVPGTACAECSRVLRDSLVVLGIAQPLLVNHFSSSRLE